MNKLYTPLNSITYILYLALLLLWSCLTKYCAETVSFTYNTLSSITWLNWRLFSIDNVGHFCSRRFFHFHVLNLTLTFVLSSISTILPLCSFSSLAHNSSSLLTCPWIDLSSDCSWCIEFTKKLCSLFGSNDSSPPFVPPPSIVLARRSTYSVHANGSCKSEVH